MQVLNPVGLPGESESVQTSTDVAEHLNQVADKIRREHNIGGHETPSEVTATELQALRAELRAQKLEIHALRNKLAAVTDTQVDFSGENLVLREQLTVCRHELEVVSLLERKALERISASAADAASLREANAALTTLLADTEAGRELAEIAQAELASRLHKTAHLELETRAHAEELTAANDQLAGQIISLTAEQDALRESLREAEEARSGLYAQLVSRPAPVAVRDEGASVRRQLEAERAKVEVLRQQIIEGEHTVADRSVQIMKLQVQLQQSEATIAANAETAAELKREVEVLRRANGEAESRLSAMRLASMTQRLVSDTYLEEAERLRHEISRRESEGRHRQYKRY